MKKIIAIVGFIGVLASSTAITSAGYFDMAPVIRCDTHITNTLQIGSSGAEVYTLQQMLLDFGFLNVSPNGYFGSKTASAVRAFQRDNDIRATGIVGPATRDAVNEGLCDNSTTGVDSFFSSNTNQYDPFVRVITPSSANPAVYATPQNFSAEQVISPAYQPTYTEGYNQGTYVSPSPIIGAGIVYNPSTGYSIGIVPQSGSITVASPVANSVYKEGDTVYVQFSTENLKIAPVTILLESSITGQSKTIAVISNTSYSFVLTKELLDSVCSGTCNNNQQGSFKVVVTTPTTDIAGITSTLRAAVAPITISRPPVYGQVSITASKTPVNPNEVFKLYINLPSTTSWNAVNYNGYMNGAYTVKVQALCTVGVTASIAGTPCGQEFVLPMTSSTLQQEVPVMIGNTSWYKQNVIFRITAMNGLGHVIGTGETTVTVNPAPFNW
jgi:peptidoglycan hydrolase-like protein with peptidoglycan-binding domain